MRKILLSSFLSMLIVTAFAQYPCENSISTNPVNPVNNQLPSMRNTFFNWEDSIYQVQPITGTCLRPSLMESPFFKIDNLESLRQSKDMKWEDGWELLRRGFGLSEQNQNTTDAVPNAYYILYNRYTGVTRVLLKACRGVDYNAAQIIVSFSGTSQVKTDLFELSRGSVSALDKKYTTTAFALGAEYYNDNTKWFYGDFPVMYDPCTCNYQSKLSIVSKLISTANISITGTIAGDAYSQNVGGKAQVKKSGIGWKDVSGFVNGKLSTVHTSVNGLVTESQKIAENIGSIDTANKKSAWDQMGKFLKSNQWLKTGLSAVPYVKYAVALVDVFTAGGKQSSGPQEVKLHPLTINLTAKLTGTLTIENGFHTIEFTNPGSKDANLDPAIYPYYNEVLGVFNLVKTPVLFRGIKTTICDDARRAYAPPKQENTFRFDADSFYYALNPASGLSIQNMQAAIVVKATPKVTAPANMANQMINSSFQFFEGKDAIDGSYKFRSEYFDMKCLDRQILKHTAPHWKSFCEMYPDNQWYINYDTVFLKIMINLKRNNATPTTQNVLIVYTYPMKVVTDNIQANTPTFLTCDSTILAPASATFINSFCSSTVYNSIDRFQSKQVKDSIAAVLHRISIGKATIYPNPSNGNVTLKIESVKSHLKSIVISDMAGRIVYTSMGNDIPLEAGLVKQLQLNLGSGTYIVSVNTSKGEIKTKLIITN